MVEVRKSKDGSIEEISDERTIQEKYGGGSKFVILPEEFFTIGGLPLKKGDKVKVALKLKGGFKIGVEVPVGV